jgi:hypothetical protein
MTAPIAKTAKSAVVFIRFHLLFAPSLLPEAVRLPLDEMVLGPILKSREKRSTGVKSGRKR